MKKIPLLLSILILLTGIGYFQSCKKDELNGIDNNAELLPELSSYVIFQGNPADLNPSADFKRYEISTTLFSDYAEKQRLIKIPGGAKMIAGSDGLPEFPEGTILVKTFYYFNDKRDESKGKTILETRLLIQSNSKWNVGTYLWNKEQTTAHLITTGLNKTVNWITENGKANVISYHVPSNRECTTCHSSSGAILPIGPKIRNLNFDVTRNGSGINQLNYFQNEGVLNAINPSSFAHLPNSRDLSESIENRARAYLDVNCAHCHNQNGFAAGSNVFFGYELPFDETRIANKKSDIITMLSKGDMPKLGTTLIDEEGLALIKNYIESLK
jgi:uncharacterized repeat protein (TIGR03806 family)